MSPLFMDINSPGSPSAEDSNSNTEREGEGQTTGRRKTKRQEKNRDAARRSRRKQTERADELHEELQCLEQSISAYQKEIAKLKKEQHLYTKALERHEPFCHLRDAATGSISNADTSSTTCPVASPSVGPQTDSAVAPQAVECAGATASSLSTSATSSLGLQYLNCIQNKRLTSKTPAAISTTLASSSLGESKGSSSQRFTSSSSLTVPYSGSFSTAPAPHSLFSDNPASLFTSMPQANVTPVLPVHTSQMAAQAPPKPEGRSLVSANSSIPVLQPGDLEAFLMKQMSSFTTASSNAVPSHSDFAVENASLGCPKNLPQPSHFDGNSLNSMPFLQDPTPQSLLTPQLSHFQNDAPNPGLSLLSLLTVPSPLIIPQTTSNSFDVPFSEQPPGSDPSGDVSLSELLEIDDWLLE